MDAASPNPGPQRTSRQLRLRKFPVLFLWHRPARLPFKLDEEGFVALADVLRWLHGLPNSRRVTRADGLTAIGVRRAPSFARRAERFRVLPPDATPAAATINPENCGTMEKI